MTTAVYKIGGSLLSLPDLAGRVKRLFASRPEETQRLLLVGGGPTADLVREWDRTHGLGEEHAHWLALKSLGLNESLVAALLPGSRIVASRTEAEQVWKGGRLPILCVYDFLREVEASSLLPLPHTWEVTSDSIAAWVAAVWPADRLVLLKSVSLAKTRGEGSATADGLVDRYFDRIAPDVAEIGWVNLRDDALLLESWPPPGRL